MAGTDSPTVLLSGGPASGYVAEIREPPLYFVHSPLRLPTGAHKSAEQVANEARTLWTQIQSVQLSDFRLNGLPTVRIVIRQPAPHELEATEVTHA